MHVDGFRFDLASIMTRGSRFLFKHSEYSIDLLVYFKCQLFQFLIPLIFLFLKFPFSTSLWDPVNVFGKPIEGDLLTTGSPLGSPPLIDMISNDPILREVKVFSLDYFSHFFPLKLFPNQFIFFKMDFFSILLSENVMRDVIVNKLT